MTTDAAYLELQFKFPTDKFNWQLTLRADGSAEVNLWAYNGAACDTQFSTWRGGLDAVMRGVREWKLDEF